MINTQMSYTPHHLGGRPYRAEYFYVACVHLSIAKEPIPIGHIITICIAPPVGRRARLHWQES